jgi:iron complex transport system substrate-binding protein
MNPSTLTPVLTRFLNGRATGYGIACVLLSSLALTACSGGDGDESGSDAAEDALLPEADGDTTYPLTYDTPYGETTIPERPERVAVLGGLGELEVVLGLGVSPVAAPWESADWPWWAEHADQLADAEVVDPWADALPIESLAATEPDIIVALSYAGLEDDWDALTTIAPVLAPEDEGDLPWQETTEIIGDALDLRAEADQLIVDAEAAVTEAASEHPEYEGQTLGLVMNRGEEAGLEFLNTAGSSTEELLTRLGFAPHPNAEELAAADGEFSLENLQMIEADRLLIARHGGSGTVEDAVHWLEDSEIYGSLDVVQRDAVGFIDPDESGALPIAWALSYPNVLTLPWTVDQLTEAMASIDAQ